VDITPEGIILEVEAQANILCLVLILEAEALGGILCQTIMLEVEAQANILCLVLILEAEALGGILCQAIMLEVEGQGLVEVMQKLDPQAQAEVDHVDRSATKNLKRWIALPIPVCNDWEAAKWTLWGVKRMN
jgi:hypothetical protein